MTKAIILGLSLIAAAFIGRGYIEAAHADDGEIGSWKEFRQELVSVRQQVHAMSSTLAAGLDRTEECRYATSDGHRGWSTPDVRRTIACAVAKWPVEGGLSKALDVASCESGPDLMHPREPGGYSGTYQQSERYWPGRQNTYSPDGWELPIPESSGIPRANVVVSIRMASGGGWGPWSCA